MVIDTHCHLDAAEFAADRGQVHAAALAAGVRQILIPAVAVDTFAQVKMTAAAYPGCLAAYGIHPLFVMQARESDIATLAHWLAAEKPLAVGEIGLDYFVEGIDRPRQAWFFGEQLQLAQQFALPVLLHGRRAIDEVLKYLRRYPVCGGIAHAFNGSRQQADEFIKRGFKLGFGGAMTYPGASRIRHLAASLPLESIVLETDAPDIPPVWLNRRRNSPAELPRIAVELAELRGISLEEVVQVTSAAARQVLPGLSD